MSCLPQPPEIFRTDSANSWQYNRSTLGSGGSWYIVASSKDPFPFLTGLSREEEEQYDSFETQFKKFMYAGVSVQRLLPNLGTASGKTRKERRTLWLILPEVGLLQLGVLVWIRPTNTRRGREMEQNMGTANQLCVILQQISNCHCRFLFVMYFCWIQVHR
jgi:hypothetical protein